MSSQSFDGRLSRRQLLRRGLTGTMILGIASSTTLLSACAHQIKRVPLNSQPHAVYQFLQRDDVVLVSRLAPAIVGTHWPEGELEKAAARDHLLARLDLFITRLGAHNMHEIRQLFDLLNQSLMRGLTTGIWRSWDKVETAQVQAFLMDWKHSRLSLFNSAYNALTDIIGFAWYSNPANTASLGYAGPPAHIMRALPQFQEAAV